jgi:hypothetical protein
MEQIVLERIVKDAGLMWQNAKELNAEALVSKVYDGLRNEYVNDDDSVVGPAFACRMGIHISVSQTLHMLLGFLSDTEFIGHLEIGGITYGEPLHLLPGRHVAALHDDSKEYAIPVLGYHSIRLLGIPEGANVYAIGVRVTSKEGLKTICTPFCIKNVVVFANGLAFVLKSALPELPQLNC